MQAYTTHRNPDVFPIPESFDPNRWIPKEKVTDEMNELFMPFSKGSRACLGINIAYMELKVATAAILSKYQVEIAPDMQPDDMDQRDHFLIFPKGGKCNLVFKAL
jgi:cytochrome P450